MHSVSLYTNKAWPLPTWGCIFSSTVLLCEPPEFVCPHLSCLIRIACLSACLNASYMIVCFSVCLPACLPDSSQPAFLPACRSVWLFSVCLPTCLPVCLTLLSLLYTCLPTAGWAWNPSWQKIMFGWLCIRENTRTFRQENSCKRLLARECLQDNSCKRMLARQFLQENACKTILARECLQENSCKRIL